MGQKKGQHHLDGPRVITGNSVDLLVDGAAAMPAMLEAISAARHSIAMASYVFAPDGTGERFREALTDSARRGVSVRLMVDGVGSYGTKESFFAPLTEAGGRVAVFRPPRPWRPRWTWRRRDHRKILVVDDEVGCIGGLNIADEYAPEAWGGGAWHDMHARIAGPAARELTQMFNRTWRLTGQRAPLPSAAPTARQGEVAVQVLENRIYQRFTIHRSYLAAIRRARETVRITNAYFVPVQAVQRALRAARRRGARVQLLLAGTTDVPAAQFASRALYARLMEAGLEVYEWNDRVLHAKCAVIDHCWCSIGSYNLNRRSLLHDLEANIACVDPELGRTLDAQFDADLAQSTRIDPETWHRRPPVDKLLEELFYKLRVFI